MTEPQRSPYRPLRCSVCRQIVPAEMSVVGVTMPGAHAHRGRICPGSRKIDLMAQSDPSRTQSKEDA